jgi:quinol monooxygenase YgiN
VTVAASREAATCGTAQRFMFKNRWAKRASAAADINNTTMTRCMNEIPTRLRDNPVQGGYPSQCEISLSNADAFLGYIRDQ